MTVYQKFEYTVENGDFPLLGYFPKILLSRTSINKISTKHIHMVQE